MLSTSKWSNKHGKSKPWDTIQQWERWDIDTCRNMNDPQTLNCMKEICLERLHIVWFQLHKVLKQKKLSSGQNLIVVALRNEAQQDRPRWGRKELSGLLELFHLVRDLANTDICIYPNSVCGKCKISASHHRLNFHLKKVQTNSEL